ncbi:siderophore-interacting protein [Curtobacterium flaccumfaciens pv. flaccumfaciens]
MDAEGTGRVAVSGAGRDGFGGLRTGSQNGIGGWHGSHLRLALPHGEDPAAPADEPPALPRPCPPDPAGDPPRCSASPSQATTCTSSATSVSTTGSACSSGAPTRTPSGCPTWTARSGGRRSSASPRTSAPHCANYTVAAYRLLADGTAELDIDFVVHLDHRGELEGRAAIWACAARPGEELAMLDQGCIFDVPAGTSEVVVAAEETGLPGVVGIAASLPRDTVGRIIQEVPTPRRHPRPRRPPPACR